MTESHQITSNKTYVPHGAPTHPQPTLPAQQYPQPGNSYPAPYPAPYSSPYSPHRTSPGNGCPGSGTRIGLAPLPTETLNLEYHRLAFADPKSRWWKPLIEGPLILIFIALLTVLLAAIMFAYGIFGVPVVSMWLFGGEESNHLVFTHPAGAIMVIGCAIVLFPAMWLARMMMGPRPWGLVHSVTGRMRWKWLGICLGIALPIFALLPVLAKAVTRTLPPANVITSPHMIVPMLITLLILTSLRAYAQEVIWRGFFMQTLGSWLRHPALAICLPAALFIPGLVFGAWAQLVNITLLLTSAFLVWRTGGLEASLAMNTMNLLFNMFLAFFTGGDPFMYSDLGFFGFLFTLAMQGAMIASVLFAAKKLGIQCTGSYDVVITPERWQQLNFERTYR